MEVNNQIKLESGAVQKQTWTAPLLQVLSVEHIKQQQEDELLYYALINDDSFRLLTGSLQGGQ